MRGSLLIMAFFVAGILLAYADFLPGFLVEEDLTLPALWLLMGIVGLSLGADRKLGEVLRLLRPKILLLPLATTAGTFAGSLVASLFLVCSVYDCLAVGAGFAYYSLSSIFITQYKGPDLGAVALLCNIARELFTLLFSAFICRIFGPLAAISCGGASTMDTTLPIISRVTGPAWVFPSIIHAVILDFSVPFWVTLFCSM